MGPTSDVLCFSDFLLPERERERERLRTACPPLPTGLPSFTRLSPAEHPPPTRPRPHHGQLLSLAVQWGVAIEIERAIKKSARFC